MIIVDKLRVYKVGIEYTCLSFKHRVGISHNTAAEVHFVMIIIFFLRTIDGIKTDREWESMKSEKAERRMSMKLAPGPRGSQIFFNETDLDPYVRSVEYF